MCSWVQGNLKELIKTRTVISEGTSGIYPALVTRAAASLSLCILAGFSSCKEEQLGLPWVLFPVLSPFSQCRSGKESFVCEVLERGDAWCGFWGATLTKTGEWNWSEKDLLHPCARALLEHQAPVGMSGIPGGCWWDKTVLAKGKPQALASAWMRFSREVGKGKRCGKDATWTYTVGHGTGLMISTLFLYIGCCHAFQASTVFCFSLSLFFSFFWALCKNSLKQKLTLQFLLASTTESYSLPENI